MFVRVTWTDGSPDRWQAVTEEARQSMLQELRSQPGWVATALLADRQTGADMTVGYWESQEALQASEPGHADRLRRLEARGARVQEIERVEIVHLERSAPPQEHTFVRVNDLRGTPTTLEEAIAFVREQVAPLLKRQKGFRALIVGVNLDNGRSLVSSIWDSAADREARDAALIELRRQGAQIAGAEQTRVELYEVLALVEKSQGALAGQH